MKADIARLLLLQEFGGIWADLRLKPNAPHPNHLLQYESVVVEHFPKPDLPNPNGLLNNTFISAEARHQMISNALRLAVENVFRRHGSSVFAITGPSNLLIARNSYLLEFSERSPNNYMLDHKSSWGVLWDYGFGSYNSKAMHWSIRQKNESPYLAANPERLDRFPRPVTKFDAIPGLGVGITDILSKEGFHPNGGHPSYSWVCEDKTPTIWFWPFMPFNRFRLKVYTITDDYPLDDVTFFVNGELVTSKVIPASPGWNVVELGPFQTMNDQSALTIFPPYFIPVRELRSDSNDRRSLSIALAWIEPFL
jgi:hypothetical protein